MFILNDATGLRNQWLVRCVLTWFSFVFPGTDLYEDILVNYFKTKRMHSIDTVETLNGKRKRLLNTEHTNIVTGICYFEEKTTFQKLKLFSSSDKIYIYKNFAHVHVS
jgi:hypothetical protein